MIFLPLNKLELWFYSSWLADLFFDKFFKLEFFM